jgi:hypothetical protein
MENILNFKNDATDEEEDMEGMKKSKVVYTPKKI